MGPSEIAMRQNMSSRVARERTGAMEFETIVWFTIGGATRIRP